MSTSGQCGKCRWWSGGNRSSTGVCMLLNEWTNRSRECGKFSLLEGKRLTNRQIQNRLWKVAQGEMKPEDILKEGVTTTRLIDQTLVFIGSQGHFHECWCVEHLAEQVVMALRMDVSGVHMADQKGMSRSDLGEEEE